jgi:hypothetical protein
LGRAVRVSGRFVFETDLPEAEAPAGRTRKITLKALRFICLTVIQLAKQACLIPQNIANAFKQRRLRAVRNELEVERLDRIRNPSKYLGK